MADVLAAFTTIGGTALEMLPIIQEAWDLFKTRPLGWDDGALEPACITQVFDADEPGWELLNARYFADRPRGPDIVEGAVLRYAAAHPEDFAPLAAGAIVASRGAHPR